MTQGPAPSLTRRSELDPREDEADARGPLLTAPAPGVAPRHDHFLGGAGDRAAGRELGDRAPLRCPVAGRTFQANRGFLDHAAAPLPRATGPRQFPDLGGGLPAPVNLGHTTLDVGRTTPTLGHATLDLSRTTLNLSRTVLDLGDAVRTG
ncbi:SAM-dependent methyltransferase [Actinomadura sp. 9N215]|uniref:SAM-dependent methyltransferase n=1 Tax=Actinomadura sp. 9N215 TaxID=3375150 RepID=UPI003797338A